MIVNETTILSLVFWAYSCTIANLRAVLGYKRSNSAQYIYRINPKSDLYMSKQELVCLPCVPMCKHARLLCMWAFASRLLRFLHVGWEEFWMNRNLRSDDVTVALQKLIPEVLQEKWRGPLCVCVGGVAGGCAVYVSFFVGSGIMLQQYLTLYAHSKTSFKNFLFLNRFTVGISSMVYELMSPYFALRYTFSCLVGNRKHCIKMWLNHL